MAMRIGVVGYGAGVAGAERISSEQGRYHDYYGAFAKAVREGGDPPVTAAAVVRTLDVLDAARVGAGENRVVTIERVP